MDTTTLQMFQTMTAENARLKAEIAALLAARGQQQPVAQGQQQPVAQGQQQVAQGQQQPVAQGQQREEDRFDEILRKLQAAEQRAVAAEEAARKARIGSMAAAIIQEHGGDIDVRVLDASTEDALIKSVPAAVESFKNLNDHFRRRFEEEQRRSQQAQQQAQPQAQPVRQQGTAASLPSGRQPLPAETIEPPMLAHPMLDDGRSFAALAGGLERFGIFTYKQGQGQGQGQGQQQVAQGQGQQQVAQGQGQQQVAQGQQQSPEAIAASMLAARLGQK